MFSNPPDLPSLTVNRSFMEEFIAAEKPCCALGLVEVQNRDCAFIALRPEISIPSHITDKGFAFGHTLIGNSDFEVIQFVFDFYGFKTFNVLLNPNNPIVQSVLTKMMESGDYFFFTLDKSSGNVTTFRSEIGQDILINLTDNWQRIQQSSTTDEQYLQAAIHFVKNPDPKGELLQWVCGDNIDYLDLTQDRLEMKPA
jgi:hypothetical protein